MGYVGDPWWVMRTRGKKALCYNFDQMKTVSTCVTRVCFLPNKQTKELQAPKRESAGSHHISYGGHASRASKELMCSIRGGTAGVQKVMPVWILHCQRAYLCTQGWDKKQSGRTQSYLEVLSDNFFPAVDWCVRVQGHADYSCVHTGRLVNKLSRSIKW